jgi:hypothetical protein
VEVKIDALHNETPGYGQRELFEAFLSLDKELSV